MMNNRGITMLELLLVMGIIGIISVIVVPIQVNILTRQRLTDATFSIKSSLRAAVLAARLGTEAANAGVWFGKNDQGEAIAVSYRGHNYNQRKKDFDLDVDIPGGVTLTVEPLPDVNFHRESGMTDHATIITVENSLGKRVLHVNVLGTVIEDHE